MQLLIAPPESNLVTNTIPAGTTASRIIGAPVVLKLLAVSILLPDNVGFRYGELRFSAARVILLVLTPIILVRFGKTLATRHYRFVFSDLFVVLTGIWMFVAFGATGGVTDSLNHAGPTALEFCMGYLVARVLLSEHGQAVDFVNFLCWGVATIALLGLLDTLTHKLVIHELANALFGGGESVGEVGGPRYGLIRAASTSQHPIIFGFTCAIGFLLATSISNSGKIFKIFACGLGMLLSLSAAPIEGAMIGLGLLIYNRILDGVQYRWAGLIGLTAAGTLMLYSVTEPIRFILNHLVLDSENAWYRNWVWQVSTDILAQTPWIGLGFNLNDDVPNSVDSVWLHWALLYGVPGSLLFALSIFGTTSLPTNGPLVNLTRAESKLGTTLGILWFVIALVGFTVDFFGTAWILVPLLLGVRAHLGELGRR